MLNFCEVVSCSCDDVYKVKEQNIWYLISQWLVAPARDVFKSHERMNWDFAV